MQERKACRSFYRNLRNAMTQEEVSEKSSSICERVFFSEEYRNADVLLGYYPLGNEVDCKEVLQKALIDGKRVALPRTAEDGRMDFYEIGSLSDVAEGTFHVMEPKSECKIFFPVSECEKQEQILVLVPGVVFDRAGNRYGYGKGYYDRYFARFPKLKRMALAYEKQIAEEMLNCLPTDMKMHQIMTDTERIDIKIL